VPEKRIIFTSILWILGNLLDNGRQKKGQTMTKIKATLKRICEVCGGEFVAAQHTSRFCSKRCSQKAYKMKLRESKIVKSNAESEQQRIEKKNKRMAAQMAFSITATAQVLGVCRQTVYNLVYAGRLKAKRITNRIMLISRDNINDFLQATENCQKLPAKERQPITEWYSKKEAMDILKVESTKYRRIINQNRIPERKQGVYSFVSKKHIDEYNKKNTEQNQISNRDEWLTVDEIAETYGLSMSGVYSYVSSHGIPKKTLDGQIKVYSKYHIDKFRNNNNDTKKENRETQSNVAV
jgi:excisionase family DNA binding protein